MAAITWGKQSGPHEMSLLLQVAAMPSKMLAVIREGDMVCDHYCLAGVSVSQKDAY